MTHLWHTTRCRRCHRTHVLHFRDIVLDVDMLARRAMGSHGWYPVSSQDWLCPACGAGESMLVRESAIALRDALWRAVVTRRAA